MSVFARRLFASNWRPGRAAGAGLIATAVYSLAMETDKYLLGNHFHDVKFMRGLLGDTTASKPWTELAAWMLHFLNGALLAEVYAAFCKRLLPGPNWLKGVIFGEAFVIAAWSMTPLVDRYHPMIKNGQLPRLGNWNSFWQNLLRHFAFGITLGLLYRERARRIK
ncbi:MAG TPA: DUF6789 family protein [Ktedonobacteraceae bacterium]